MVQPLPATLLPGQAGGPRASGPTPARREVDQEGHGHQKPRPRWRLVSIGGNPSMRNSKEPPDRRRSLSSPCDDLQRLRPCLPRQQKWQGDQEFDLTLAPGHPFSLMPRRHPEVAGSAASTPTYAPLACGGRGRARTRTMMLGAVRAEVPRRPGPRGPGAESSPRVGTRAGGVAAETSGAPAHARSTGPAGARWRLAMARTIRLAGPGALGR